MITFSMTCIYNKDFTNSRGWKNVIEKREKKACHQQAGGGNDKHEQKMTL